MGYQSLARDTRQLGGIASIRCRQDTFTPVSVGGPGSLALGVVPSYKKLKAKADRQLTARDKVMPQGHAFHQPPNTKAPTARA